MIKYFTSESVTKGHPDKVCDLIADRILDAYIKGDPFSRVACEVTVIRQRCHVFGEVTSKAKLSKNNLISLVRKTIKDIGYTKKEYGFDYKNCKIRIDLATQSPDIALGVDKLGAGDQGMMFGYACNDNESYLPDPIYYAHKLSKRLEEVRESGLIAYLRPDGKTQVTVKYNDDKILGISCIVVSAQHNPYVPFQTIYDDILRHVIKEAIPKELLLPEIKYFVNPTGSFVIGGPAGDSGLTGRKNIVDTYGGFAMHGGGSFSGKDPTKVDRSAAYMTRYIAKNIVAAGLCDKCEIEISYAIGVTKPLSVFLETFGTSKVKEGKIANIINEKIDLSPSGIINKLDLRRPFFALTTNNGHFGRSDKAFTYEQLDLVVLFKTLLED